MRIVVSFLVCLVVVEDSDETRVLWFLERLVGCLLLMIL